ncbi:MAG TPA: hypothetical protein VE944_31825 [Nostoc sp.]|uniref:hypothetical protein n=2 Tax=Nostoc TaxID=1177 RepID=UPI002D5E5EE3|nr:hypothetical protein [Nostoc sp.]HYX18880.1 hypothetical protein [Nostoc sp.]
MQHIPISLVFACGIDGQDTNYNIREIGIPYISWMQSSSAAHNLHFMNTLFALASCREGGDFRNPLTTINRWQSQLVQQMLIGHNLAIQIIDLGRRGKASYLEVGILMALSVCPYN